MKAFGLAALAIVAAFLAQPIEGTAVLKGRVVDAITGKPLPGVAIRAGYQPRLPYTPGIDPRPPDRTARTDSAGVFEIPALAAGDYSVTGSVATRGTGYLAIAYGMKRPGGQGSNLVVAEGARPDITIRAWPAASVGGHVIDERGRPVVGVSVRLLSKDNDRYGYAATDDQGAYRVADLPPGRYTVFVPVAAQNRTVKPATAARQAGTYSAPWFPYLVDRDARTIFYNPGVPLPPPGEDGQTNVFVSSYYGGTSASDASYLALAVGEERSGVDITLRAQPGRRVAGVATVASGSVAGVIITLKPAGTTNRQDYDGLTATAASDGTFVFVAAPEGAYTLTAFRRGPPLTEVSLSGGVPAIAQDDYTTGDPDGLGAEMPLTIGDSDIDGLTVNLGPGTRIKGRAIFDNEPFDPRAMSIGAFVSHAGDMSFLDTHPLKMAADGTLMGNVQPGAYVLRTQGGPRGWWFTGATLNGRDIGDGPFLVGSDPISDLEIFFSRAGTRLTGAIAAPARPTTADVTVVAFSADRGVWPRLRSPDTLRAKRVAARNGSYEITGLLPGQYFVVAVDENLMSPALSLPLLEQLSDRAARISLQPGQPATLNLTPRSIDP